MKKITIGILAHVDAGKTTLAEAILFNTKMIKTFGRVDKKTAFLDTDELEKQRGITIYAKEAYFKIANNEYYLIDTPGHKDFSADMELALSILDLAIVVVSVNDLNQAHSKTIWSLLKKYNIPVIIFINKMDISEKNTKDIMFVIKRYFNDNCINFNDKVNYLENISLTNEKLLNYYLNMGTIENEMIANMFNQRKIFPCFFGSALKNTGITELLATLNIISQPYKYTNDFSAQIYKITRDTKHNRLVHLKVTGGILKVKDTLVCRDVENNFKWQEKVNEIRVYNGIKYENFNEVIQGTVCEVTGLNSAMIYDNIGEGQHFFEPVLKPIYSYRIKPLIEISPMEFLNKISELIDEQPNLQIHWDKNTQEIKLKIMGVIQLEILKVNIKERFNIDVDFEYETIIYKETINNVVEGVGHYEPIRHYAEVHLLIEPLKKGSGIVVKSSIADEVLDLNWQKAILETVETNDLKGVLTNSLLTDVKITLINAKANKQYSSRSDFIEATNRAIRQGLMQAENVLLEPYYHFQLEVYNQYSARALFDLQQKHAIDINIIVENDYAIITGRAPVVEISDYYQTVLGYTKAEGILNLDYDGYDSCNNSQSVINEIAYDPLSDENNSSASIFCKQNIANYITWDKVYEYMDLPVQSKKEIITTKNFKNHVFTNTISQIEIDNIINQTYYANRNNNQNKNYVKEKSFVDNNTLPSYEFKKTYLVIDGYNVIFTWDDLKDIAKDNIGLAREKLIARICNYQAYRGIEVMIVFDAYRIENHQAETFNINNVMIVYTKQSQTADTYIEKFSHNEKDNYVINVVTSDNLEQIITRANGALIISSRQFYDEVIRIEEQIKEYYNKKAGILSK